jgi:hypothetical protein
MKNHFLFFLAVPLFLLGCESQEFEFVGTINTETTYLVDNSGSFNESAQVVMGEFIDSLDIPENSQLGDVNIESLAVMVEPLDGNQASSVYVSGNVNIGGDILTLFNNFQVTSTNGSWMSITGLAQSGIVAVKDKFQQYLDDINSDPFTVSASGYSAPAAGSRVHARITIQITSTVKYTQKADVPWFIQGAE